MLNDPRDLRIPGPTPVPPQVMEAMQQPMVPHRGAMFARLFAELQEQLKRIHGTKHDVFVLAGTGSAGWEASIVNTLNPGDKVLAIVNGNFGERFVTVAECFGMNVVRLDFEWGKGAQADDVKAALDANPDVRAVLLTHNETSTGVLNPVKEIGKVVREHGALLFVDAVSGLPGAPLEMDAWHCDVVFSGSQKAFMCPPGLSIIAVGERVWEHTEQASIPRYMLDFKRMRDALAQGSTPSTAPLSLLYALKAACDMIEAEGLENVVKRGTEQGAYVRAELEKIGLKPIAEPGFESPTVTAAATPEGVTSGEIISAMIERHGIYIAASQGPLRDSVIRIGHMGWTDYPELERTLKALDDVLEHIPAKTAAAD
jgi:aspartate aminotransferase-like enzyme